MKVEVELRQWLRAKAENFPALLRVKFVQRLLRVGQGPQEFIQRLMNVADSRIRFVTWPIRGDISLFLIHVNGKRLHSALRRDIPKVVRLDGIGLDNPLLTSSEYDRFKEKMINTLSQADAVIFQSEFSRQAFESVYGKFDLPVIVIHNGVPDEYFSKSEHLGFYTSSRTFVVAGRDTPRKRIGEIVKCFVNSPYSHEYELAVVGEMASQNYIEHENVHYYGRLVPSDLRKLLRMSRGLIHLDWYDWCPNLIVEAIAAGAQVLCGSVGGSRELVKDSGLIADIGDPVPNFNKLDRWVPNIDQNKFDKIFGEFVIQTAKVPVIERNDLKMSYVANRYFEFITSL